MLSHLIPSDLLWAVSPIDLTTLTYILYILCVWCEVIKCVRPSITIVFTETSRFLIIIKSENLRITQY